MGLFGVIGTSNIGNEGMLEAVVNWLRTDHPEAIIDFMCTGPERVNARYGAPAIPLGWYQKHERAPGVAAIVLRTLGKGFDAFRVATWVRKHDVVIVPGAGSSRQRFPWDRGGIPTRCSWSAQAGEFWDESRDGQRRVKRSQSAANQMVHRLGGTARFLSLLPRHRVI